MEQKGFYVNMYDAVDSNLHKGKRVRFSIKCASEEEQQKALRIANHYKSDFSRIGTSLFEPKQSQSVELKRMDYKDFIEFVLFDVEWYRQK